MSRRRLCHGSCPITGWRLRPRAVSRSIVATFQACTILFRWLLLFSHTPLPFLFGSEPHTIRAHQPRRNDRPPPRISFSHHPNEPKLYPYITYMGTPISLALQLNHAAPTTCNRARQPARRPQTSGTWHITNPMLAESALRVQNAVHMSLPSPKSSFPATVPHAKGCESE